MTRPAIPDPGAVRARLNEGLVLAHGIASGANQTRDLTAVQDATVRWAIRQAIAHASVIAAAVCVAELEAAGDPEIIDAHDVWAEAA